MNIIERIRQQEQERENRVLENKRQERLKYQQEELANAQAKENHLNFMRVNTERIMMESGVLFELKKIDEEILAHRPLKHKLLYKPEKGTVVLVWGKKFSIEEGEITYQRHFLSGTVEFDAVGIEISVYPHQDREDILYINSKEFNKEIWEQHPDSIENALIEAFLNPRELSPYRPYSPPEHPDMH